MANNTSSIEARELSLVEKVEFKFALADTDSKLQTLLNTYLSPLLLKLGSEHKSVREKVISSCQHINNRIKPQTIRLPVAALLKQFKDNPDSSLIRHFDLLYAQQGIQRLSSSEQAELLPSLVAGVSSSSNTPSQAPLVFHFLLRSLVQYRLPPKGSPEDEKLKDRMDASDDDIAFLAQWFGKLMLLKSPFAATQDARANPGLGSRDLAFLTLDGKPETWSPSRDGGLNLSEVKVKVLALLGSGLFNEENRLFPALLASSDQNSRISETAEDLLKRALSNANLEDSTLQERLLEIYFGSRATESSPFVPPASARLKTRILGALTRAKSSSSFTHEIIRLVEEDLLQDFMVAADASKTDRELSRLRAAIITFLTLTARRASTDELDAISRPVIQSLRLFIEQEAHETKSLEIRQVRGNSFEIIGLLAAANKELVVEPQLELLTWMFQSLAQEGDRELIVSIDQALSSVLRCFQTSLIPELEHNLAGLLLRNVKQDAKNKRNVRYASVRFANRCLSFQNVVARWIDILVMADTSEASHETIEEARLGLDPYRHKLSHSHDSMISEDPDHGSIAFASFTDLVEYFFWDQDSDRIDESHINALAFCRQGLLWNALIAQSRPIELGTDWDRRLDVAISESLDTRTAVRKELSLISQYRRSRDALITVFNNSLLALKAERLASKRRREVGALLVEMCILLPEQLLATLAPKFSTLLEAVLDNDMECRNTAGQAYALLTSRVDNGQEDLDRSLKFLCEKVQAWNSSPSPGINQASGALIAISGYVSRRLYVKSDDDFAKTWLQTILPLLLTILRETAEPTLLDGACTALSQLSMFYSVSTMQLSAHLPIQEILDKIATRARTGDEKAIATLGHLSLVFDDDDDENLKKITDHVYKLHELRQAESQFAVGEALSCIACGWQSTALLAKLDLDAEAPQKRRKSALNGMLDQVFSDTSQTKPSLRKASVLWLLCFVQFCGEQPEIQSRLGKLQAIFKRCLSDRDELIQESASRGLGLVYEKGSRDLKDDLVRDLVGSFSSDRADTSMSGTVTEDTQLFEPGSLPTGEGQSVSTYKDIMSLASEVGDSSLVYRFMNLASSDALWSSRAAFGRFGLSSVLSDSSVDGYLANNPKLYPKLFRYRFDPTPKVANAMDEIWKALVRDPTGTVDKHFSAIMDDLLANILGKEWRVRQACCKALADLVQGRELEKINPYLERLWTLCSKVLDDIKGSVRGAAAELSRVLTGIVLRTLEANSTSSANAGRMLESVIPFLFSPSGLESSAEEVQASSLNTLLEITKKANAKTLRPFVPDLIENLLGLLTSLESSAINYIYLNASKYNLEESEIDSKRLSSVRSSPLMDAIKRCLDALDDESMPKLSVKLQSAMRAAVGVPSKVGCALILVSLSTQKSFLFRPYADSFLTLIPRYISDRNETVSQSYAAALGYVARGASESSIIKSAGVAKQLYFESEGEKPRITSGEVVRAIAKYATDKFASLGAEFLPFAFFARHDEDKEVKKLFEEVWNDNTGGPRAASLYVAEIVQLVSSQLASPRWTIKHAAALAIADLVTSLSLTQGNINESSAQLIWPPLKQALMEKTWQGKERVLEGFVTFAEKGHPSDLGNDGEIRKIIVREAKRRNIVYQSHAIGCFANLAAARTDLDLHEDVCNVVEDSIIIEHDLEVADKEKMEVDGEAGEAESRLRSGSIDALFKSLNVSNVEPDQVVRRLQRSLDLTSRLYGSGHSAIASQSTLFASSTKLTEDLATRPNLLEALGMGSEAGAITFQDRLAMLIFQHDAVPETARLARSAASLTLAKLVSRTNHTGGSTLRRNVQSALNDERVSAVRDNLTAALQLLIN